MGSPPDGQQTGIETRFVFLWKTYTALRVIMGEREGECAIERETERERERDKEMERGTERQREIERERERRPGHFYSLMTGIAYSLFPAILVSTPVFV